MALEITNVVAGYTREVQILNGLSVSAADGRVTLLLGPNGAGKSTLLKTIYGYLSPQSGEVLHDGKSLVGLKPKDMLREGIAYLIQGHSVFARMTVEENLELGGWIMRNDKPRMKDAFDRLYARYPRLKEKRHLAAGVLSGGEQRMLEIARLTMTGPKTLLLDEPSVGLMPRLVDAVYEEIGRLKEERYTILIVDQNVRKAISIADYVYALALGENRYEGPRDEIARRLDEIVKEWI
jgi:branched-chain amino acid transport system ATP-binding protein